MNTTRPRRALSIHLLWYLGGIFLFGLLGALLAGRVVDDEQLLLNEWGRTWGENSVFLGVLFALMFSLCAAVTWRLRSRARTAAVFVLGDIGRSPRMQYHTLSLASDPTLALHTVYLIGYLETQPRPELLAHPRVRLLPISSLHQRVPRPASRLLFAPFAACKLLLQTVCILRALLSLPAAPSLLLVQTPPALPTLPLAWLYSCCTGSRLLIDWHNFGYSLLALALSPTHWITRLSCWLERVLGTRAHLHLCVTEAMREFLLRSWGIHATTLYDCPPDFFRTSTLLERHRLFTDLSEELDLIYVEKGLSAVTMKQRNDRVMLRKDRPAVLVSGTSWTEDEDFGMLLDALCVLDRVHTARLPRFLVLITGKGPMRDMYMQRVRELNLSHVSVHSLWLKAEDYPRMLGSADLGISLHTSSSALDLPMKVVDMFGCRLPVCAVDFPCLPELVRHQVNGLVFRTADELASQLQSLFTDFPLNTTQLDKLRDGIEARSWDAEWTRCALPVMQEALSASMESFL
mmetsp:Transcript_34567/g.86841  ORF Transcript_34567/g.86841 Transcript_34567/m.86841 type:complete len:518 (-) Transcript_34567:116-1669(-)